MHFIKKTVTISAIFFFLNYNLYSQTDSSAESYFPATIDNSWHYKYTQTQGYITTLTRDSVANGSRFLFFDSSSVPAYEIDSMLNVWSDPTTSYRGLQYKLTAQKSEVWPVKGAIVARVDDVYWQFIFGVTTQVRKIGYYSGLDTTFSVWFYDRYLAAGFGFYLEITDASQTPSVWLAGCIIEGKTYGDMTYVGEEFGNIIPSSYKLFNAYPNPFNPSTVISYQLPHKSFVTINAYDMLGREIATLVDEEQEKGFYKFNFTPKNLSSGIYLVRMNAGSFTQTTKIIYSK